MQNRVRRVKSDPSDQESNISEMSLPPNQSTVTKDSEQNDDVSTKAKDHTSKASVSTTNAILSCCMYCFCSVSMVLTNKAISTTIPPAYHSHLPKFSVVLYQNLVAVILVTGAKYLQIVEYPSFNKSTAMSWIPVNLLFVGMICSGFLSLVYVSVPMVTIFKNMANIMAVSGEYYFFKEPVSWLTVLSILIMTVGAVMAGMNDLEFSVTGYFWMSLNAICTAGYTLYMRYASTNIKLSKFGMVFYNNFLSLFLIFPLVLFSNELITLLNPHIMTVTFITLNTFAGLLGFYLNFASLWCVSSTSATTYSIIGSLNKVPILILGFLIFHARMTNEGIVFICLATIGGFIFVYAKLPKK